jgi:multidrug efflux pump subunit AcrB
MPPAAFHTGESTTRRTTSTCIPDIEVVRGLALRLASTVAADPGTRDVNFDWMEPARELRIRVDQEEARRLGLSSDALASALASTVTGTTVTQVRDDIHLVDVVARATEAERVSIDSLRNLQVPIPGGRSVALAAFATFEYGQEQPIVWRRNRVPSLTVQADVPPGTLPDTVMARLAPAVAAFTADLPRGYRVEPAGTVEESAKSRASVFAVVPVMLLVTLTLLMTQLQSFQRMAIVLSVVPLGLIGVVAALLAFGRPLGFVAILCVLSLLGMIAKNAVILLGQIEIERAAGLPVRAAVVEAAASRFRPIMLTAVSTVLGMIPIAFTVFWGPMAIAIMGGLLAATMLTLVFLPAVYFTWFGGRRAKRVRAPTREPVAPAEVR